MVYCMYCKLFASLYQGTLRGRSNEILVFTNLLAHAGKDGTVDKHFRAISEETGLSMDEVKEAIAVLEAPDPESRSPDENGSRLVRMDEHRVWGWRIVNYGKYRAIRSEEDRAEQNRLAQQRWRERNNSKQSKPPSATSKQDKPKEREKGEAEAQEVKQERPSGYAVPACFENVEGFTAALAGWIEHRKKIRKPPTGRAIQLIVNKLAEHPERAVKALDTIVLNGWQSFEWEYLDNAQRTKTNQRPDSNRNIGHNANLDYSKRSPEAQARIDRERAEAVERIQRLRNAGQSDAGNGAG